MLNVFQSWASFLNKLLRNAWVSVTGNKAHKVATLIEAFGCDQVEASDLEQEEPWEKPISDLREMIADLARSTAAIASTQSTAATISTPQRMEAPHQDIHQTRKMSSLHFLYKTH
ncbi:unnamed protein product [Ceratitis capitata]|uniref:(Mediterranean fruit fly) hypothetical protein n=1 Tax=Ceratitis capitata TaxID=7213 RepID=A0A811UTZ1_CERCA|nr:unnamed protein product [Ceratitis capitata]